MYSRGKKRQDIKSLEELKTLNNDICFKRVSNIESI